MSTTTQKLTELEGIEPNTLIQYRGGGYDGCIWEYNYCFIDGDGEFHNITATGYAGIKTADDFRDFWKKNAVRDDEGVIAYTVEYSLIPLKTPDQVDPDDNQLQAFCDENGIDHVIGVAKWFAKRNYPFDFMLRCAICDKYHDAVLSEGYGLQGLGGTAIGYSDVVCAECSRTHTCEHCGELYLEADSLRKSKDAPTELRHPPLCVDCPYDSED